MDEETGFLENEEEVKPIPTVKIESFKIFKFINFKLWSIHKNTLFNWKKYCIAVWGINVMFYIAVHILLQPTYETFASISIFVSLIVPVIGYTMILINMFNGGWGKEDSHFWCHVRQMFMEGYNTLRWTISSIIDCAIIFAISSIIHCEIHTSFAFGINLIFTYFILSNIELSKAEPIDLNEKYAADFDVDLVSIHKLQKKSMKAVDINGVMITILSLFPLIFTSSLLSWMFILYQFSIIFNSILYYTGQQTFVQSEIQYDIIHILFRIIILWIMFCI